MVKGKKQEKQSKVKNARRANDPGAPTRARSAYNVFTRECGEKKEELFGTPEEIKEKGGFLKCASKAWKALSEKDKQKYQDQADKDKERYDRQFEQFEKTGKFDDEAGQVQQKDKKETKKGKQENKKKQEETEEGDGEEEEEEGKKNKKNMKKKSNKRMCGK